MSSFLKRQKMRREGLAAGVAVVFLIAAVSLHERAPGIVELEGLRQSGNGLALPIKATAWEISSGPDDARLSDQVARWTRSKSRHHAGEILIAGEGTQQLAQVSDAQQGLKHSMKVAAQQLRMSNFLSGVSPRTTEHEVLMMYHKMDPKDSTGWEKRAKEGTEPPKKVTKKEQLKQIKHYKSFIEGELSTSPTEDSAKAKKMRSELKALLARRAALQKSINDEEDGVIANGKHPKDWTRSVKPDPAENEDIINRLTRREDAQATFHSWIAGQQAKAEGMTQDLSEESGGDAEKQRKAGKKASSGGSKGGSKRVREDDSDLIRSAEERYGDHRDSMMSIEQRAAYKVNRWTGGGYVQVYDMAQG